MRLFVAIDSPPWVKKKLALAQNLLPSGVRKVEAGNLHITLKFLGEVTLKKIPSIEQRLGAIDQEDFEIKVRDVGAFPNEEYVRVVWAGCKGAGLKKLAEKVDIALKEYPKEEFTGHITIARVAGKAPLRGFFQDYRDFMFGYFNARKFLLMASELTSSGPKYSVLAEFPLRGAKL
ncbi:MAG: RNA 2',3'-cyclic phosphodiesterase [Candidatus ainarchaeum sp.]|nr:RNA 2',3'-cyclic phosphodiesterase [Candidatus ainarchaeum sp.]